MEVLKTFFRDVIYIILNYIVNYIPIWFVRKLIYQLLGMKIGSGSRICMKCVIMSPWNISIGSNTMINEYCLLDGRGKLTIGNNCSISMFSIIYTATHSSRSATFEYYSRPTEIKDNCWLGTRCVIMPGSIINEKAVISVNSVFKGVAKENTIYIGNPAEEKRHRDLNVNYQLNHMNFFK